jgi:hypothetical protein
MKKIFLFLMLFSAVNAVAQKAAKVDSAYYLLDTTCNSSYDNMWETGIEGNLKYYSILCPCLAYGTKPTFAYPKNDEGRILSAEKLPSIKLISLVNLIEKTKLITNKKLSKPNAIFLIEPFGKDYVIHKVGIVPPRKPYKSVDYEIIKQN